MAQQYESAAKEQGSFQDVFKSSVGCKLEERNYSALLATGETLVEVLYPIWDTALKDRDISSGDNPEEIIRNDQLLANVSKEEWLI